MTTTPTQDKHVRRTVVACGPDPIDVAVGARLRRLRIAVGKTQESLGAEVGVTFQQMQKYERGANRISASRLVRLARALGCSPASFFTELEGGAAGAIALPSAAVLRLAAKLDKLPPRAREGFAHLVDYTLCASTEIERPPLSEDEIRREVAGAEHAYRTDPKARAAIDAAVAARHLAAE